jgi:hypothetical protein
VGQTVGMAGALVIVVVLVIAIPVGVLISGMIGAAIIGSVLKADGDANASSPELIDLNG